MKNKQEIKKEIEHLKYLIQLGESTDFDITEEEHYEREIKLLEWVLSNEPYKEKE